MKDEDTTLFTLWTCAILVIGAAAGGYIESCVRSSAPEKKPEPQLVCDWPRFKPWVEQCLMHTFPMTCRYRARELFCKEKP